MHGLNTAQLSLEQTPALAVPFRFLLVAPFFAALAGVVYFAYPDALSNRWSPAALAITHLLTLGFISMVMVGALQQLLPVLAGVKLRYPDLFSSVLHAGMLSGTLLLCAGFLGLTPGMLIAGGILLLASFAVLIIAILASLFRSDATVAVTAGMKLALLALLATLILGAFLAAGHSIESVPLARHLTGLHVQWGFLGWVGLLVITISYQVVPMFQVTPKYPDLILNWLARAIFSLLVLIAAVRIVALDSISPPPWLGLMLEAFLLGSFVMYALLTLRLQRLRRRKVPDVTLDYWRVGLISLILACAVAGIARAMPGIAGLQEISGILFVVGFAVSVISGMLYKIVPFLVWLHLTNTVDMRKRWQMKIPNMKQIIPDRQARNQYRLHVCALLILALAPWRHGLPPIAAVLFTGSSLYLGYNLIRGARVYRRVIEQSESEQD